MMPRIQHFASNSAMSNLLARSALALLLCTGGTVLTGMTEAQSVVVVSLREHTNGHFSGATEVLAMMIQVVGNLEEKVRRQDLASIHDEDLLVNEGHSLLLQFTEPTAAGQEFSANVREFVRTLANLHLAGDNGNQDMAEKGLRSAVEVFEGLKRYFPKAVLDSAQKAAEQYVCPRHNDVRGTRTDFCSKCGSALDQQVRFLPEFCGRPWSSSLAIIATVAVEKPLTLGVRATCLLKLTKTDGSPVRPSDLIVSHTERIHLLIIDSSLSDYHHEHPTPTPVPGEYSFSFTPHKPGPYMVWADVRRYPIGRQEYIRTTVFSPVTGEPFADRAVINKATADNLTYELRFDTPPKTGRPIVGRLRISHLDGTPFAKLEPIMGSFVHLVGFHEDCRTLLHIHPRGAPATNPNERGGPEFEFQFHAPQAGFVRLFVQVQIAGASKFVPFGVQVDP